ncbi:MAG: diguanylate cyclase [Gammaproteobacteria bacterium]|nr:diguanylate cyclase [Gammaproteobacteria bacterium]
MTSNREAQTHYCETYGFDAERRRARLNLLDLTEADAALGDYLRSRVLVPNGGAIAAAFYTRLRDDPESQLVFDGADLDALHRTMTDYLWNFGAGFDTPGYFEERLRIGLVHAWVGVPLGIYLCACQVLRVLILEQIDRCIDAVQERLDLCAFVNKIVTLDAALASDIYHIAQLRNLEMSVTRLSDERARLRHAADTDALTGLANRASLLPRLAQFLTVSVRTGEPLCVIMADLDLFKEINDTHGHLVGDQVLRDTAVRMRTAVRDFDLLGRYGGEEFLIVLHNTPLDIARQVAERVRRRIGEYPFSVRDIGLRMTISQGIALAHAGDSVETLLARADAALYAAKQAGRNRVMVADDPGRD